MLNKLITKCGDVIIANMSDSRVELDHFISDMGEDIQLYVRNSTMIHFIADKGRKWIEDFVDEDTCEVVSIDRFQVQSGVISKLRVPKLHKSKDAILKAIQQYLDFTYGGKYQIKTLITAHKYHNIENGNIKKYKSYTQIDL